MILRADEQVGQYKIISELGRGGMATVYKAYHEKLDRHVAVKVMHQTFAEDNDFAERFKREAQIVARLDHPHIVPVYDYNEYNGMPYLVMKIVQGRSLKQMLIKKPPTLDEIIRIMTVIADATTYAHNQGILHRDIKPSNIVIDNENVPYLADFGLARIAAAGESTMSADVLLGTPNYMSPEQAKGAKDIDFRSDLYSLGIVLYELVVGQVPFSSPTPLAVIQDHINTPLPRPSEINPDVPQPVERVLRKALAKKPDQRYHSANQMISEFTQAVRDGNLESLADDRKHMADDSLARWRDAYVTLELQSNSETEGVDSIAQSIKNLAQPSLADVKPQSPIPTEDQSAPPRIQNTLMTTTATRVRHEPYARIWMMTGAGIFILSVFLMASVILNASNTILAIADISQQMESNRPNLIQATDEARRFLYDVADMDVETAREAISADPEHAMNYLALAKAYYIVRNLPDARLALNQGKAIDDNLISYFATAASLADDAGDTTTSLVYAILLWEVTLDDDSEEGQLAYNAVTQLLYNKSLEVQNIRLSRDNITDIEEILGNEDSQIIVRSPITRIIVANNHIEQGQTRFATLAIRLWDNDTYMLSVAKLVSARYDILIEDIDTAITTLTELVEASTTPQWIVTIARNLINEIKD